MRWGTAAPGDADTARDLLLDAAEACFERSGISGTTMDDIAKQARVSRATVYRYFTGRDTVVAGVAAHEARIAVHNGRSVPRLSESGRRTKL